MKIKIGNQTFEVSKEVLEGNPEEITLDFNGTLRTTEEDAIFIENHKKEARKEGLEIAVKQHRDEYGFTGRKLENLIEAVKKKTAEELQAEPNEQIDKLNNTLKEKETALQNALTAVSDKDAEFANFKQGMKLDKFLGSVIPEKTLLPKEDMKLILKTKLNFDFDDNGSIVALDASGNVIKDPATANPKNPKDVVDNFFKDNQNYLKGVEGGSGGGDSSGSGKKKTIDEFIEEMKGKDINPNSPEFNDALKSQIEAGLVEA